MKVTILKDAKELPIGKKLEGADIISIGTQLKRVTFKFEGGDTVECIIHSYNELAVFVKEPPKMVDRWVVAGVMNVGSALAKVVFDRESDANDYGEGNLRPGYSVKPIKVPEENLERDDNDPIPF